MPENSQAAADFLPYYEKYKKAIFNYILYRTGFNKDNADDLTSEIFLKAFEHFDSFDKKRSFRAWIFTIAHNHLVTHFITRKQTLPLDDAIQLVRDHSASEELYKGSVDHEIIMSKMLTLVDELPDAQREIITMRFVNDLKNHEIAQALGKDEGAIRTMISRALATLRSNYSFKFSKQST